MISKRITYNLLFLFLGQGASAALFFASMAYLARTLGPEGFGVIGFSEVVFMFFLTLSSLGTGFIGTREVARERRNSGYYVDTILSLRLLLGGGAFLFLAAFVFFLQKPAGVRYTALVYGLALIPASLLLDWLFQGLEEMYFVALGVLARAVVFAALGFWLIKGAGQALTVALVFALSWLVSSALMLLFYVIRSGAPRFRWNTGVNLRLLKDSWPIGAGLIVGWVIHYFDSTAIFLLKGEEASGEFSAAYRPIILMATALTVYFNAIFPAMSRAAAGNSGAMARIVNITAGAGVALLLPVAVLGTYLSGPIMNAVYGPRFSSSAGAFAILLWWPLIVLIISTYTRVLVCYDRQGCIGKISGLTAFCNIAFNLALIPFWGGKGASVAKIAADVITLFVYHRAARGVIRVPFLELMICPLIGMAAMVAFMSLVDAGLWGLAAGGTIVYVAALFISSRFIPGWRRLVAGEVGYET